MVRFLSPQPAISFDDVLLVQQYSDILSRSECDISTKLGQHALKVPIIASNMDTITGIKMVKKMDELGGLAVLHRYLSAQDVANALIEMIKENVSLLAVSVGSIYNENEKAKIKLLMDSYNAGQKNIIIFIDMAHGYSKHMIDTLRFIRGTNFAGTIVAGTVCTESGTKALYAEGANVVRVGVGAGSACTTRIKTGSGYPQLSAIWDCASRGIPILADGGIRTPGDAAKALAAGASSLMIGGMLAGTDCVPGWTGEGIAVPYRGMASNAAKGQAGIATGFEEGVSLELTGKPAGSTAAVIADMCDGIRSGMSYTGARTLAEFTKKAVFTLVSPTAVSENNAHILRQA